jgi:hypothetical protein
MTFKLTSNQVSLNLLLAMLAAVRGASTLAFATILAFATVVTGLAAALAFARVLSFAGMFFLLTLAGLATIGFLVVLTATGVLCHAADACTCNKS